MDTLTPGAVAGRALEIADADGLAAVSMRRLARELGVTPMALYWHFGTKEALLDGMADRVLAEVGLPPDDGRPWRPRLEGLLRSFLDVLRRHPAAPDLLTGAGELSEHRLLIQEAALALLAEAGFSPEEAVQVVGHATGTLVSLARDQAGRADEQRAREVRARLLALPPERYPHTIEAAGPISACADPDTYYAYGIALLLAGIDALAAERPG
ncbi:TetR/AcrR family transcriptional regulator C-terminal domain-containing protein [Nocardiopsis sp. RSe5-2]|uniref:TetR/AcrR family transcriptional regulator C-terminal domain-containing protein n=1 Tax=Nocardiopsis endophytica TaxID=3018445 RepID=A0ABT4UE74_9ACTN|nr:TetR/AcrR family transcriptional regulator C-terminal domain-containing protein [Nocardiopsis endophytica]MDA2815297.1 TetR/AcrR family transcriptional regulator C-terminal domain-containing protein [Nocardiopsis endophytica]